MKKYLAEFIGTFGLSLAVSLSIVSKFPVPTPVIAGLTLALFVYTIGDISGCHINPAVTIGLLSIEKINVIEAIKYIIAQFAGAGFAIFIFNQFVTQQISLPTSSLMKVGLAELVGTFFFAFGIAAVVYEKVPAAMKGLVIGGSLLLGISVASILSNGILNPAVAMSLNSLSPVYILGPIVGAVLGMWVFRMVALKK